MPDFSKAERGTADGQTTLTVLTGYSFKSATAAGTMTIKDGSSSGNILLEVSLGADGSESGVLPNVRCQAGAAYVDVAGAGATFSWVLFGN